MLCQDVFLKNPRAKRVRLKRASRKVGDKKAAEVMASTIRAKLQLGEFGFEDPKPVTTFKEYAESWIKTTVPATCKESTVSCGYCAPEIPGRTYPNGIRLTRLAIGDSGNGSGKAFSNALPMS